MRLRTSLAWAIAWWAGIGLGAATGATVRVQVVDDGSGRTVAARAYLWRGEEALLPPRFSSYARGDERHFLVPGDFELDLERGTYRLRVERGLEYLPVEIDLVVPRSTPVPVRLCRWVDMNGDGWYSADMHVHRDPADIPLILRAEDLNFVPTITTHVWSTDVSRPWPPPPEFPVAVEPGRLFTATAQEVERIQGGPGAEQYGERGLVAAVGIPGGASRQLAHDWNLRAIRTFTSAPTRAERFPTTLLVSPDGTVVRRWEGLAPPADLGLTLRSLLGPPPGSPAIELPKDAPGSLRERIGVFLRCTGQDDPGKALAAVRSLGLDRVQVSRLPDRFYTPEGAREFAGLLKGAGVRADAVVVVFDGESYADQESVMRTVGLRPAALRPARMDYAKRCIDFAEAIGTTIVTFHMGFLPRDPKDPVYGEMLEALGSLAAYAAPKGVTLSLETGQETGEELVRFLDAITVARVGVNFDTANLVLYGLDDPPRALERLRGRVTSLHVKDGLPPDDPRLLGREVPLGEGRARVRECLRLLEAAGFQGPLIIENYVWRERGTDPLEELARARDFILGHDRPDARAAEPGPDALRVLVVTGGHDYPTSFYTVFEGRPEWVWSHAPSSEEAFAKEIVSRYDVLVLYDFSQQLGEEGKAHLKAFAEAAKGIVVLHHAICDYQDWPWFEELVGGRYLESDQGGWKASTYRHDVELFVRPVGSHPIVNPVGPLRLVDETYKGMRISPKVTPILEIDHPDGDRYVGWVSPYERSRVVYLQLGHDERAHRSQAYRDLVRNAILWSAGR